MDITDATIEELQAELVEREKQKSKPEMLNSYDLKELKYACQMYLNGIAENNDGLASKWDIYENAMITFFGKHVIDWIAENKKDNK